MEWDEYLSEINIYRWNECEIEIKMETKVTGDQNSGTVRGQKRVVEGRDKKSGKSWNKKEWQSPDGDGEMMWWDGMEG